MQEQIGLDAEVRLRSVAFSEEEVERVDLAIGESEAIEFDTLLHR